MPDPNIERDAGLRPRRGHAGTKSYGSRGDLLTTRTPLPRHHPAPDSRLGSGHGRAIVAGSRDARGPGSRVPAAPHGGTFR